MPARDLAVEAEQAPLPVHVERVAGLGLAGGDAEAGQAIEPRAGRADQLLVGGGAGGPHRREDAAARGLDLQVGGARGAQLELGGAAAGEHRVRVGLDQPRRHQAAAGVEHLLVGQRHAGQLDLGPGPGDPPVADEEGGAGDAAEGISVARDQGQQLADVDDGEGAGGGGDHRGATDRASAGSQRVAVHLVDGEVHLDRGELHGAARAGLAQGPEVPRTPVDLDARALLDRPARTRGGMGSAGSARTSRRGPRPRRRPRGPPPAPSDW